MQAPAESGFHFFGVSGYMIGNGISQTFLPRKHTGKLVRMQILGLYPTFDPQI